MQWGASLVDILIEPSNWRFRRVDSLCFVDYSRMKRKISIDLQLPIDNKLKYNEHQYLVPLSFVRKGSMSDFDARDEVGHALPVLGSKENSHLASSFLINLASRYMQHELQQNFADAIFKIVACKNPFESRKLFNSMTASDSQFVSCFESMEQHRHVFLWFLETLSLSFILFVLLDSNINQRRIVKFSLEEEGIMMDEKLNLSSMLTWLKQLGIKPWSLESPAGAVGDAKSFHIEFIAPEGLQIGKAELFVKEGQDQTRQLKPFLKILILVISNVQRLFFLQVGLLN